MHEQLLETKRHSKLAEKQFSKYYRPHNLELKTMENIRENYKTLLNLGFVETKVLTSNVGQTLNVP